MNVARGKTRDPGVNYVFASLVNSIGEELVSGQEISVGGGKKQECLSQFKHTSALVPAQKHTHFNYPQ